MKDKLLEMFVENWKAGSIGAIVVGFFALLFGRKKQKAEEQHTEADTVRILMDSLAKQAGTESQSSQILMNVINLLQKQLNDSRADMEKLKAEFNAFRELRYKREQEYEARIVELQNLLKKAA